MDRMRKRILIVDDSEPVIHLMTALFRDSADTEVARNGRAALELVKETMYDLIISDVEMRIMDGFEFFRRAVTCDPSIRERFLFFSSSVPDTEMDFITRENVRYLMKPGDIETLQRVASEIMNPPSTGVLT